MISRGFYRTFVCSRAFIKASNPYFASIWNSMAKRLSSSTSDSPTEHSTPSSSSSPSSSPTRLVQAAELNKRLAKVHSASEALSLFTKHKDLMDPVNLGACLHRVCKLEKATPSSQIIHSSDFNNLVQAVHCSLPQMTDRTLGAVVWSLAKAGRLQGEIAEGLASSTIPRLDRLGPQTFGLLAWGLTQSRTCRPQWLEHISREFAARLPSLDDVQTISSVAHSLAKRGRLTPETFRLVESRSLELIERFPTRSLELLLQAMAVSKKKSPALLMAIARNGMEKLGGMDGFDLATFARGYAKLDFFSDSFLHGLVREATEKMERMDSYAVTNLVWSLATLRLHDQNLMDSVVSHALNNVQCYSLQDIGNLAWGLAVLNCNNQDLFSILVERVEWQLAEIQPFVLLNFLWCCLVFDIYPPKLYERVFSENFLADLNMNKEMLHQFCQLHVGARYEQPGLKLATIPSSHLSQILSDVKENMKSNVHPSEFQSHVVAVLKLILGGYEFLRREVVLDYGYSIDVEVLIDKDEITPVSHGDIQLGSLISRLVSKESVDAKESASTRACIGRKLAIEMDGPWHFIRGTEKPVGSTVLKQRQLKALGWEVIDIPYFSWATIRREEEQEMYLKKKLFGK